MLATAATLAPRPKETLLAWLTSQHCSACVALTPTPWQDPDDGPVWNTSTPARQHPEEAGLASPRSPEEVGLAAAASGLALLDDALRVLDRHQ